MYKRILIVVGAGQTSRAAIAEGVSLAKVHDAEVLFFSVLPRYVVPVVDMPMLGVPSPDAFQREAHATAERLLTAAALVADKAGVRHRHAVGSGVDDAECIVDAARKRRCSLIVVASAGSNAVMRLLTGSVIPGLITHSPIPVLVCREVTAAAKVQRLKAAPAKAARRKPAAAPRARRRAEP